MGSEQPSGVRRWTMTVQLGRGAFSYEVHAYSENREHRLEAPVEKFVLASDFYTERELRVRAERERDRALALLIPMVDVGQRRLNGGPYCIHVEGDGFCGRAERWEGHSDNPEDWPGHPFKDGEWLAQIALAASPATARESGT